MYAGTLGAVAAGLLTMVTAALAGIAQNLVTGKDQPYAPVFGRILPPIGFVDFCARTKIKSVVALSMLLLAGCAKAPESIALSYISDVGYQSWNCQQLAGEQMRLSQAPDAVLLNCRLMSRDNPHYRRFCGTGGL